MFGGAAAARPRVFPLAARPRRKIEDGTGTKGMWTMCRPHATARESVPANWGELLDDLGRGVKKQISQGAGTDEIPGQSQAAPEYHRLALAFVNAPDVLKLRAMVENWPLNRIVQELARTEQIRARRGSPVTAS